MIEPIDIIIPAVRRPKIFARALESVADHVFPDPIRCRLIVNIDPVGNGSVAEMEGICNQHFGNALIIRSKVGSLNAALKSLWGQVTSRYCFYTEDDIVILRDYDLDAMVKTMDQRRKLAFLQIPERPMMEPLIETVNFRLEYIGFNLYLRSGKYRFALQPSLLRREFIHKAAQLLETGPADPEDQFHTTNRKLSAWLSEWDYMSYAKPGESPGCMDAGMTSRDAARACKHVGPNGTTWIPTKQVDLHGTTLRAVDYFVRPELWDEAASRKWRADTYKAISQRLQPHHVFLDVGAYIGTFSLWAARHCAAVYAFEPDLAAYEALTVNVKLNRLQGARVVCSEKALGPKGCTATLTAEKWGTSLSTFTGTSKAAKREVKILTLDAACKIYAIPRVDYLKITTQGMEAETIHAWLDRLKEWRTIVHTSVQPQLAPQGDRRRYMQQLSAAAGQARKVTDEKGNALAPKVFLSDEWVNLGQQRFILLEF